MNHSTETGADQVRLSYISMFRAAPAGAVILVLQAPNWCTSIATQACRKIKTEKSIALGKRGGSSIEMTKVIFLGEKPAKTKLPTPDPRQITIPGLVGETI